MPSAVTQEFDEKLSKQRLDFKELPNGKVRAILTVTLPGNNQYVYTADVNAKEAARVEGMETIDELRELGYNDDEIAGLFGDIFKGIKKVAKGAIKVVKTVATSKVFKLASKGLAIVAPALGPLAPAALAVSGGMMTATALLKSRHAASKGNKKVAAKFAAQAVQTAKKVAPKNYKKLIAFGNDKSKAALRIAAKPPKAMKSKPIVRPSTFLRPQLTMAQQLAALRKGPGFGFPPGRKLFGAPSSSTSNALARKRATPNDLLKAARAGRVYVVQAK